jgi:hypothetical protein
MNRRRVLALVSGLVAIAAVALLLTLGVFSGPAATAVPGVSTPDVVSAPMVASAAIAPAVQEPTSAPGAPQEGINVHGHWTIVVTNPDGSLAERREFDNALIATGARALAMVLGRLNSVGGWGIHLLSNAGEEVFLDASSIPISYGFLYESSNTLTFPYVFKTLTVSVPTTGENMNKLVLSGTATAQRDGKIKAVYTRQTLLNSSLPPASSYSGWDIMVTETTLASPVNLLAGQQVSVTVVISFS